MLELPPPHATSHTWREFVIHIANIVVGAGLEQTSEAIHCS
jgi:hypothetical protein